MKHMEDNHLSLQEQLSALHDGELGAAQARALVSQSLTDDSLMQQWRRMSAIGGVLREQRALASSKPSIAKAEPVAQVVVMPRAEAANDGAWRWKMVAGFAAFAAVGSLAWGLLGSAGDQMVAAKQLQNAPAASASTQALMTMGGQVAGQEVMMIRDPRLDELLAAHKQFGGSSALQQPAGSLRSVSIGSVRP